MKRINYKETGNRFHKKLARVLLRAGFKILQSDPNAKGPDIIAKFGDLKIIIQCKHSPNGNYYSRLEDDVDSYSTKLRHHNADRAILALSGYRHKILSQKLVADWLINDKVAIWNDAIIDNYKGLANSIRHYAAFQILGDLGLNEKYAEPIAVPATPITQHGQQYYLTALPPNFLLQSAYVARRAQGAGFYQRYLSKKRVTKEIPDFIEHENGLFPNTLILVASDKCKIHYEKGKLHLPSRYAYLWVIDGQHRLYSFCNIKNKALGKNYQLACTIFDGAKLDPRDQAHLFLKINTKAKKAPPPLIVELAKTFDFDFNSRGIYLLKKFEVSPYFVDRIRTYTNKHGTIDSNTFSMSSALNELIRDNGVLLKGRGKDLSTKRKDNICYQYLHSFFKVVCGNFRTEWNKPDKYILSTNQGYRALLRLFLKILRYNGRRRDERQFRNIIKVFKKSNPLILNEDTLGKFAGEGGAAKLADEWARGINKQIHDFDPTLHKRPGVIEVETTIPRGCVKEAEDFLDNYGRRFKGVLKAELAFIDATTIEYLIKHFSQCDRFYIVFSKMHSDDKRKIDIRLKQVNAERKIMVLTKCEKIHERRLFDDTWLLELKADLKKNAIANSDHDMHLIRLSEGSELVDKFDKKWEYFKTFTGRTVLYDWDLSREVT